MTALQVIEWLAALLTIGGAWLLARNGRHAAWGWVLFLGANALWILFGWITGAMGLMVQQLVLTVISLQGVWIGLVRPRLDAAFVQLFEDSEK